MKQEEKIGKCIDCERENVKIAVRGKYKDLCKSCRCRKSNAKRSKAGVYIPYKDLSDDEKKEIDAKRSAQKKRKDRSPDVELPEIPKTIPVIENYYQAKAENNHTANMKTHTHIAEQPVTQKENTTKFNPLSDQASFVAVLRECGCEIPEDTLTDVLNVLISTSKLKDIFLTITKNNNQKAMLDLEQALNVIERKLQHNWEYNGFKEEDDIKFKGFLTWRRELKGDIFFWKKLYQTNTLVEMQRAWNSYTQDPNEKVLLVGDKIESSMKRFQITTESISTIFNTKRPFTRVFYAETKEDAYEIFVKWMADRQLHENKSKTTITELKNEGENTRYGNKTTTSTRS